MKCDCPFCPLVQAKVDICGFDVCLVKDGSNLRVGTPKNHTLGDLAQHMVTLVFVARNNYKLKVDHHIELSTKEYTFNVSRLNRHEYRVCFHTN